MLFARLWRWLSRRPEQPVYGEAEAYARCHGDRATDVIVRPKPPPMPRILPKLAGDFLQRCFEERLERRRVAHRGYAQVQASGSKRAVKWRSAGDSRTIR